MTIQKTNQRENRFLEFYSKIRARSSSLVLVIRHNWEEESQSTTVCKLGIPRAAMDWQKGRGPMNCPALPN